MIQDTARVKKAVIRRGIKTSTESVRLFSVSNKIRKIPLHAKKIAVQNDFTTISPIPRSRTGLPVNLSAIERTLSVKYLSDSTGTTSIDGVADTITLFSSETSLRS